MAGKYKSTLFASFAMLVVAFSSNVLIPPADVVAVPCTPVELAEGATERTDTSKDPPEIICEPATPPPSGSQIQQPTHTNDITCAVDKIGWIVCPVIEKAAEIGDKAFGFLAKQILETEPELVAVDGDPLSGGKSGTYQVWELARNIANLVFIAAFLIIILSQVTGRGLDNYGIKKTLPRGATTPDKPNKPSARPTASQPKASGKLAAQTHFEHQASILQTTRDQWELAA